MAADLVADEKRDDKLITPRGQGLGPDGENIQGFPAYEKNKDSILFHRDYEENEAVSYNLYSHILTVYIFQILASSKVGQACCWKVVYQWPIPLQKLGV